MIIGNIVPSLVLCALLTPVMKRIAAKFGWMAYPTRDRWHKKPTALMGGIAIYLAVFLPILFHIDWFSLSSIHFFPSEGMREISFYAIASIGMTGLFMLGLVDDFFQLKPQTKLLGQILVASLIAFFGFRLKWFESMTIDTMVTLFWVVGVTNAFNLLDNMDGLCAGIGAIAAAVLAMLLAPLHPEASVAGWILFGALAGFLIYNFNPASIFMGDCGSLTIGFLVALLSLFYSELSPLSTVSRVSVPILVAMVPVFDTSLVTVIRILSGRKASMGGKDHTSHRLVLIGLSERKAVLFLYCIAIGSGLAALFVHQSDTMGAPSVLIPVGVAFLLMGVYLSQLRIYPEKEFSLLRDKPFTPVLVEWTYKKQILLVILDLGLVAFSYYLCYRLRFSSIDFLFYFRIFLKSLPIVIACKLVVFLILGVYRGVWGNMSANDVAVYLKASTLASLLSIAAVTFVYRFSDFSKGAFLIDWLLTTAALLGTRGFFRLAQDAMRRNTLMGDGAIIYGAGRGGELLLREILHNPSLGLRPIGFIDDDPLKIGKNLQGYPVLGSFSDLSELREKHRIEEILVSFKEAASEERLDDLRRFCKENGIILRRFSICLEEMEGKGYRL
ncbi:glycosyl transferase [Desulfatirhabdium butyrativorans]|uniref:glycosyl transferase n=1 Tax=Desulfatirhabdium butyrativorans TaxID=340467 RepID=UPI00040D9BE8|nr:glycosyl transferase [Desulfatirhabdium butyrativorans]